MFSSANSRLQFQEIHKAYSAQDDILFSKHLEKTEQLRKYPNIIEILEWSAQKVKPAYHDTVCF